MIFYKRNCKYSIEYHAHCSKCGVRKILKPQVERNRVDHEIVFAIFKRNESTVCVLDNLRLGRIFELDYNLSGVSPAFDALFPITTRK